MSSRKCCRRRAVTAVNFSLYKTIWFRFWFSSVWENHSHYISNLNGISFFSNHKIIYVWKINLIQFDHTHCCVSPAQVKHLQWTVCLTSCQPGRWRESPLSQLMLQQIWKCTLVCLFLEWHLTHALDFTPQKMRFCKVDMYSIQDLPANQHRFFVFVKSTVLGT